MPKLTPVDFDPFADDVAEPLAPPAGAMPAEPVAQPAPRLTPVDFNPFPEDPLTDGEASVRARLDAVGAKLDAKKKERTALGAMNEFGRQIGDALVGGVEKTGIYMRAAKWLAHADEGDADELANAIAIDAEAAPERPDYADQFDADLKDAGWRYENAQGTRDRLSAIGEAIGTVVTSPRAVVRSVADQAGNIIPGLGGAAAGAAAGSLAGPVGTAVGGYAGMAAGSVATEAGAKLIEMVQGEGVDIRDSKAVARVLKSPGFREKARKAGLIKGGVIAAVDLATMKMAGKVLSGPARQLENTVTGYLAREGVDIANKEAVSEALASPAAKAALAPAFAKYAAQSTVGRRAGRAAGAVGIETLGEGVGEGVGQVASGGETSFADIAQEMIGSLGQSALQAGAEGAIQGANQFTGRPEARSRQPDIEMGDEPSIADLIGEDVTAPNTPLRPDVATATNADPVGSEPYDGTEVSTLSPADRRIREIRDAITAGRPVPPGPRGQAQELETEDVELAPPPEEPPKPALRQAAEELAAAMRERRPDTNIDVEEIQAVLEAIEAAQAPADAPVPKWTPPANVDVTETDIEDVEAAQAPLDIDQEDLDAEQVELAPPPPRAPLDEAADDLQRQMRPVPPASNVDVTEQDLPVEQIEGAPPPNEPPPPPADGGGPPAANIDVEEDELIDMDAEAAQLANERAQASRAGRFPPGWTDVRLGRAQFRYGLRKMAEDLVEGGGVTYKRDENDVITGRTPSLNPQWFQGVTTDPKYKMSVKQVKVAVEKALRGEKLGLREQRMVGLMIDLQSGERREQIEYARQELEAARKFRKTGAEAVGITDADVSQAAELFDEREYPPHWDGEPRTLYELADEARAMDRDATDAILESNASNADVARRLYEVINGRRAEKGQAGNPRQAPREREAEAPAEAPRAEADARGAQDEAIGSYTQADLEQRERDKQTAAAARQEADRKADADQQRDSFTLTGSNRDADEAAARGQGDLLSGSGGAERQTIPAKPEKPAEKKPASAAKSAAQPAAPSTAKIDDFGEKLEGARKDYAAALKDAMDVDVASAPLSKSWPEPDYQKLLEGGASPWTVAWAHAMRDEIPTKPAKAWKIKGWVEKVTTLRGMAEKLISGEWREETARAMLERAEYAVLKDHVGGRAELYQAVGHETSLKGIGLKRGEYGVFNGVPYSPAKVIWSVEKRAKATAYSNWPTMLAYGDTREAAIAAFKAKVGELTEKPEKDVSFSIYSYRNSPKQAVIGKKTGKGYLDLKTFDSVKEARAYLAEHKDELVAMLEKAKATPSERRETNEARVGVDHRGGADVTPEQFAETFGFRGVQFGNYVENSKRQADLNEAYDALLDLAGIIGVPPRALSLNGELGLAFGARGRGGKGAFAAHYERETVVINLTKERGAGALAHEFWHSLDNYFGRMGGQREGYPTEGTTGIKGVREPVLQAFRSVRSAVNNAAAKARANALDARRSKAYWSTGREMSARAFEAYVIAKLQDQGQSNDYLANIVSPEYWRAQEALFHGEGKDTYPYPTADEVPAIRAAFDEFFRVVETRETDKGVAMFARMVQDETSLGPAFDGPDIALFPQGKVPGSSDRYRYVVVDAAGNSTMLGIVTLGIKDGQITRLHHIHVPEALRTQGVGTRILRSILDTSGGAIEIRDITDEALDWWKKVGTHDIVRTEHSRHGTLTRDAYERATGAVGRGRKAVQGDGRQAGAGATGGRGSTPQAVREYLERKLGRKAVAKLIDSGLLTLADSTSTQAPADVRRAARAGQKVFGYFDGRTSWLFTDNLSIDGKGQDAYGILMHELGVHFGMRQMLGDRLFKEVIEAAQNATDELGEAMARVRRSFARTAAEMHAEGYIAGRPQEDTEAEIREEHVAWLVTDAAARETSLGRRILAKLRAFLVKLGFVRFVSTDTLVELARGAAMKAVGIQVNAAPAEAFARSGNTRATYEARIDELASGAAPDNVNGVRVLDRSDVLDLLGYGNHEVVLAEKHAFDDGKYNHALTVEEWKRLPEWIDGPVAVFERDDGKLTLIAPELKDGRPIVVGLAPRTGRTPQHGGKQLHVVVTAFGKDRGPLPVSRWVEEGRLRYLDQKKTPDFVRRSGLRLPSTADELRGSKVKVHTDRDLRKYQAANAVADQGGKFTRRDADRMADAIAKPAEKSRRTLKQRAQAVVDLIDAKTNPLATLSGRADYLKSRYLTLGRIAQSQQTARRIYDTFRGLSDADGQKVYAYLTDAEGVLEGVSPTVKANATRVKAQINEVGMALVERGVIPLESFEKHQGRYLPRIYLAYLLGDRAVAAVGAGKTLSTQGYAKRRNDDLPQEYRDVVLGEIKDPAFLASKALGVPLRDMAIMTWLTQIAENPAWVLPGQTVEWTMPGYTKPRKVTPFWLKGEASRLRERAEHYQGQNKTDAMALAAQMDDLADTTLRQAGIRANEVPDGFKQIPDSARYGALRGLVVKAEIHSDLVGLGRIVSADAGIAEKVLGYGGWGTKAVNLWKWSKVAANPPAQVRNIVSNFVLLNLSGVPLHRMPALIVRAVKEIRKKGRFYQIGVKYGITESSFAAQEMQRIERETLDYLARQKGRFSFAQLVEYFNRFRDLTGDAYQLSEMIGKLVKIMDSMEREGKDEADAALAAQEWLFDYSLVGQNTRYLRNAPIGAPFLTFAIKVLPRLLEVAITAPWRFLPYVGLFYAASLAVQSMTGADDDDLEALRKALPEFLQKAGHAMIIPVKDEHGRWQFVDMGYFFPWTYWTDFAHGVGAGAVDLVTKGEAGKLGEALTGTGILGGPIPDLLAAIKTGKDPFTGNDIVKEGSTTGDAWAAWTAYLWNMAMPTWLAGIVFHDQAPMRGAAAHIYEAISGEVDKRGEPRSTLPQALARLVGVNVYGVDPVKSRQRALLHKKHEISRVKQMMNSIARDQSLDKETRDAQVQAYKAKIQRMVKDMQDYAKESVVAPELR